MTWQQAWAAPLSLILAAVCAFVALASMPPTSYVAGAAAGAFVFAALCFAEVGR